jgi:hypothetical protein
MVTELSRIRGTAIAYRDFHCGFTTEQRICLLSGKFSGEAFAVKKAEQSGWRHTKEHGWVCPNHKGRGR